ncbi:hypothetical protein EDI28_14140 [Photobacterium chitinilyticum]|uniref:Uncharacterized protein n=1 Tax=Photobacterium chitinilyticum TaxID=2485123 RepID=A0A444JP50_9GAMM|nr:hypothetical protein EDI28_14140 [Photobacterium chitinilyticum]
MRRFKRVLFTTLLCLQSFFHLAYPLMVGLSILGATLGIVLMLTPSKVENSSQLICLSFALVGVYLALVKKHYSQILAWADTRKSQVIHIRNKTNLFYK